MRKGFTLIELLIVIAIIAILALIALPNFLESQIRAKVARAKGDMFSLQVALNQYIFDWNRPPVDADEYQDIDPRYTANAPSDQVINHVLSTPLAYMVKIPVDVFAEKGHLQTNAQDANPPNKPYRLKNFVFHAGVTPEQEKVRAKGFIWTLRTLGPARSAVNPANPAKYINENQTLLGANVFIYDPSNGTMSFGLITHSNRGMVDGYLISQ